MLKLVTKGLRPHDFVELLMEGGKPSGMESKPKWGIAAVVTSLLGGAIGFTITGMLLIWRYMWGGGLILAIGVVFLVSGLLLARVYGMPIWFENE